MDQRIENTYSSLQRSMRSLLGDLPWNKISVQTLCDKAEISRSTFYSHFKDKDDLLDSLLEQFEHGMRAAKSDRSVKVDGKFKFVPILLNHVGQNRSLFSNNNMSVEGYPIAIRFKNLITRLVEYECVEAFNEKRLDETTTRYVAGGIYHALVHWSSLQDKNMHFELLNNMDDLNNRILSKLLD